MRSREHFRDVVDRQGGGLGAGLKAVSQGACQKAEGCVKGALWAT